MFLECGHPRRKSNHVGDSDLLRNSRAVPGLDDLRAVAPALGAATAGAGGAPVVFGETPLLLHGHCGTDEEACIEQTLRHLLAQEDARVRVKRVESLREGWMASAPLPEGSGPQLGTDGIS